MALLQTIHAVEILFDLTIVLPEYNHPIEHLTIIFAFLMVGYGFILMRKILGDYGMMVKEIKKLKRS